MATEKIKDATVKPETVKPEKGGKIRAGLKKAWKNRKKIGVITLGAITSFISGFFTGRGTAPIPALPDLGDETSSAAAEVAEAVAEVTDI